MKEEAGGDVILEFVGLRAKAYAFRQETNGVESKKLKGIKKCVVKKKIHFGIMMIMKINNHNDRHYHPGHI